MKNFKYFFLSVAVLSAMLTSCRQESSNLVSYEDYDAYYYSEADSTYAGQFKGVWNALNSNYGIWDYETVDWDEVYDKYLPKFEALDKRIVKGDTITTAEIKDLYDSVVGPLQDGHFYMQFKNLQTGEFKTVFPFTSGNVPSGVRVDSFSTVHSKAAYIIPDAQIYGVEKSDILMIEKNQFALEQISNVVKNLKPRMDTLNAKGSLTEEESRELYDFERFVSKLQRVLTGYQGNPFEAVKNDLADILVKKEESKKEEDDDEVEEVEEDDENGNEVKEYEYDDFVKEFEQYNMLPWDDELNKMAGFILYTSQLADGVMYLKFNQFALTVGLESKDSSETMQYFITRIKETYSLWFDGIQELHKAGKLKGVVIDVRGNIGGTTTDFKYVLGALLPEGGYTVGKARTKNGTGRLDYAPLFDVTFPTMSDSHEVIDDVPIVVLANEETTSMAEITSISAKQLPNGYVIGNQTNGGMSGLNSGHPNYSETYSDCVGIENQTSFYLYIPAFPTFYDGYGLLENKGVTPDIEVNFDPKEYLSTGHDTQLDRALKFIKTGK